MYLTAESVTVDDDEGQFTLVIEPLDGEESRYVFNIHSIDLDAFYDQVKGRIGPYLQEMHAARTAVAAGVSLQAFICASEDVDESGGYATDDPKHPRYHSTHVDLWDSRAGK